MLYPAILSVVAWGLHLADAAQEWPPSGGSHDWQNPDAAHDRRATDVKHDWHPPNPPHGSHHEDAVRQTPGCGIAHPVGFSNDTATHSLQSGGLTRTYAINVPKDYNSNPNRARPLIIDYHGSGGTGWQQYENSQYFKYPAGQDYLAVYPQGVNDTWQGANYSVPGVDDLRFTTDLVAHLRSEYCIDDNRIYASGKSNGGGFVDLLACSDNGDEFGAFAMAAPALYPDLNQTWCTKRRAIIDSHGDEDSTIPYHPTEDGSGGPLPDISRWVSWWGHRTCGRHARPQYSGDLGGYNTTTYSCGRYHDVVTHFQIFDLGHCWPSDDGSNWDASDNYDQSERKCLDGALDFTGKVLDFFAAWNLHNAPSDRCKRGGGESRGERRCF